MSHVSSVGPSIKLSVFPFSSDRKLKLRHKNRQKINAKLPLIIGQAPAPKRDFSFALFKDVYFGVSYKSSIAQQENANRLASVNKFCPHYCSALQSVQGRLSRHIFVSIVFYVLVILLIHYMFFHFHSNSY